LKAFFITDKVMNVVTDKKFFTKLKRQSTKG